MDMLKRTMADKTFERFLISLPREWFILADGVHIWVYSDSIENRFHVHIHHITAIK